MEIPMTPATAQGERPGSRIRYKAPLSPSQQQHLADIEAKIQTRAETWSLNIKKAFRDFDKVRMGHVTRTQFYRIMNMMNYELRTLESDLLCQAYCDTDNGEEFNYMDFADSLNSRTQKQMVETTNSSVAAVSRRPKYFDRTGEHLSPYTPLDATSSSFRPGTSDSKMTGFPWSMGSAR